MNALMMMMMIYIEALGSGDDDVGMAAGSKGEDRHEWGVLGISMIAHEQKPSAPLERGSLDRPASYRSHKQCTAGATTYCTTQQAMHWHTPTACTRLIVPCAWE